MPIPSMTWRKCPKCDARTSHTRAYNDDGVLCRKCYNCGNLTPVKPRKETAIDRLFDEIASEEPAKCRTFLCDRPATGPDSANCELHGGGPARSAIMPRLLTRTFLSDRDYQVEDQDVVAYVAVDGAVRATFGVQINGTWYYADHLEIPLKKLLRDRQK